MSDRQRYTSDLTDERWALIEPVITPGRPGTGPSAATRAATRCGRSSSQRGGAGARRAASALPRGARRVLAALAALPRQPLRAGRQQGPRRRARPRPDHPDRDWPGWRNPVNAGFHRVLAPWIPGFTRFQGHPRHHAGAGGRRHVEAQANLGLNVTGVILQFSW